MKSRAGMPVPPGKDVQATKSPHGSTGITPQAHFQLVCGSEYAAAVFAICFRKDPD